MTHTVAATAAAVREAPGTVHAGLTFIAPTETKPMFHSAAYTGGAPRELFEVEQHVVPIHDMRPVADAFSLDREGFELRRHPSAVADFYDDEAIERVYHPEVEALLRAATGASRVVIFDATRRSDAGEGAPNPDGRRGPAARIHVDYTETSGPKRAADLLGEAEVRRVLEAGGRIVQLNVWRPIKGPVERALLALADASSVRPEHLVATDQVFPDRIGEIYHLVHDPAQRWYFAPRMTPDEVFLIKGWDSAEDGRARFTPHGAFQPPDLRPEAPARESIEIRTFVVIEP